MKMTITYGELAERFGMSDEACSILNINPYALNEGLAKNTDKIDISEKQAIQLGISKYEFDSRVGEDDNYDPHSRKVYLEIKFRVVVNAPGDMEIQDFINELEYDFTPGREGEIVDMEMLDYEVTDSK